MKKETFIEAISILFILLFTYAAVSKLLDYKNFIVQLGQSPLLTLYAGAIAWAIPSLEIAIAIILAVPATRLLGMYLSCSLMTLFTGYIIAITQFSDFIPCSCGGVLQHMTWNQHLGFNLTFLLLAFLGVFLHNGPLTLKYFLIAINRGSRKPA